MVYEERNTWAGLIVTVIVLPIYLIVILQQAGARPLTEVDWVAPMLWTIGAGIVGTIALSILWGILAGMREPDGVGKSDMRDREISQVGDRVGQAFLVIGGIAALILCAVQADWFWVAQTLFFGFALSALVGGVARVILYRRGMP